MPKTLLTRVDLPTPDCKSVVNGGIDERAKRNTLPINKIRKLKNKTTVNGVLCSLGVKYSLGTLTKEILGSGTFRNYLARKTKVTEQSSLYH